MHREIEVGGELTEDRLAEIAVRAFLLRNRLVSPAEALGSTEDGETPLLVEHHDEEDPSESWIEVHVGCGDACGVFVTVPWDGDMGCVPTENAVAIVHAGRDLLDLVREVRRLRALCATTAEAPAEITGTAAPIAQGELHASGGLFLIRVLEEWRNGRGMWWREGAMGYTNQLELAGVFTAAEIEHQLGAPRNPKAEAVPLFEVTGRLGGELMALREASWRAVRRSA